MPSKLLLTLLLVLSIPAHSLAQGYRGIGEPPLNKKQLELPAISDTDIILVYSGFVVNYNSEWLLPNWVAYELTAEELDGDVPRGRSFSMDLDYKGRQAMREDYSNTGWDKGHMAPSADMKWSQVAMKESFYLTNICPQDHNLNEKDWQTLEKYVRDWAVKYGKVWVVCGPYVTTSQYGTIGERNVMIPDGFFKAVLRQDDRNVWHSIAFVFENNSSKQAVKDAVHSINEVEKLIGYDLFTNLRNRIEEDVEAQSDWEEWRFR